MFGYITINRPELRIREYSRYRACYCGLCRELRKRHGLAGGIVLTYDMTFLLLLLNALYEPEERMVNCRCAAHPLRRHQELTTRFDAYGADMNLLLAYYKQKDDAEDEGAFSGLVLSRALKKKAERVALAYPRQAASIQKELRCLKTLEQKGIRDPKAGAGAFGRLLGQVFVPAVDEWSADLYGIGHDLGLYVYLLDAWNDLDDDVKSGRYNPLPFTERTAYGRERLRTVLMRIMAGCAARFERLPLLRDVEILRNILYSGVWMAFDKPVQKGLLGYGNRSV